MIEKRLGKYIGGGGEKRVHEDLENEDRVIGVFDNEYLEETPQQIKARFYLTKILHILFPKNIADMHWVTSEPKTIQTDKLEHSRMHKILNTGEDDGGMSVEEAREAMQKDKSILDLVDLIESTGVSVPDTTLRNFSHDSEGNPLYMDTFRAWNKNLGEIVRLYCDWDKMERAIDQLEEEERDKAKVYLERLKSLYEEDLKNKDGFNE